MGYVPPSFPVAENKKKKHKKEHKKKYKVKKDDHRCMNCGAPKYPSWMRDTCEYCGTPYHPDDITVRESEEFTAGWLSNRFYINGYTTVKCLTAVYINGVEIPEEKYKLVGTSPRYEGTQVRIRSKLHRGDKVRIEYKSGLTRYSYW